MTDFFQSDLFAIIISVFLFVSGIIIGFFTKRFHTRYVQYISERAKLKTIFAEIKIEIMENIEEAYFPIGKYGSKTNAIIEIVCSYLSKRKTKKFRGLYENYEKQENGKGYDPFTIQKIIRFR